jgi:hypothetical protein
VTEIAALVLVKLIPDSWIENEKNFNRNGARSLNYGWETLLAK